MKLRWCQAAGGAKCRISKFPAIFNFIQKDAVVCCIKVSTTFRRTQYSVKVFIRLGHKTYTNDTNRRICLRGGSCMTLQLQTTNGSKTDCFWFSVVHKWHHQFCKCKSGILWKFMQIFLTPSVVWCAGQCTAVFLQTLDSRLSFIQFAIFGSAGKFIFIYISNCLHKIKINVKLQ